MSKLSKQPMRDQLGGEVKRLKGVNTKLVEALKLAEAALSGANMNMNVVRQKVHVALSTAGAIKRETVTLPDGGELWNADPNCEHEVIHPTGGGIQCKKCGG